MGWQPRVNGSSERRGMGMADIYRIVVRVSLNKVEHSIVGPQARERVITTQVTEGFGEGETPREACERAFGNGIQSYVEGLAEMGGSKTAIIADN